MILVKSTLAGLAALAGAILLVLFALVAAQILPQILVGIKIDSPMLTGIRRNLMPAGYVLAGITAVAIFFRGFRWEYRRVKARQAN
jgi:uncharacterized membrane protein